MGRVLTAALVAVGAYFAYRTATARLFVVVMRAKAMTGKVAVVTGGTSGVGKEACKRLVSNGVKVAPASHYTRQDRIEIPHSLLWA